MTSARNKQPEPTIVKRYCLYANKGNLTGNYSLIVRKTPLTKHLVGFKII